MISLRDMLLEQKMLTIYRGISVHNQNGNYFTTDPEWARNFTQSGQDKEILQCEIDSALIYEAVPVPQAVDDGQVNTIINLAKTKGFAAIWVDEGANEPKSIFVFRKSKLRSPKRYASPQLSEVKKFNLDNKDDAAEDLIRQAWRLIDNPEDRYDFDDVLMYIDNDERLSNLAWTLGKKFYPQSEEGWYDLHRDVKRVLGNLELKRLDRKKKATPSLKDPVYILKKLMVGKSWKAARNAISNQLPGRQHGEVTDEDAEMIFNRLYKNAVGETIYDMEGVTYWGYGYLDKAHLTIGTGNHREYSLNIFINAYAGANKSFEGENVQVWRGTNSPHAGIRPGDFVTFDRGYAQNYLSGKWKAIVTDVLPSKDLIIYKIDVGMSELVYWPEGHKIKRFEGHIPTFREFWEAHRFGL